MMNKRLRSALAGSVLFLAGSVAFGAGWDNNLQIRCAATTGVPGDTFYYQDSTQCAAALPYTPHWQLAVQSESSLSASCPGPSNRSYPINGAGSPVRLAWMSHTSDVGPNWSVNLLVDQWTYPPNPGCGSPVWTWFSFQNVPGLTGFPLPSPATLATSHVINYTHWEPTLNDGTRLIAGGQFYWGNKWHFIEVNLHHANYGYPANHPPGLLLSQTLPAGEEFIILDGPYWGVTVTQGVDSFVYIPWYHLVNSAIARGWLSPISGSPSTGAVHLAVEVKDRAVANLWQTNFRMGG